jgi:hypothetical protein
VLLQAARRHLLLEVLIVLNRKTLTGLCLGAAVAITAAVALHAGNAGAQTGANQPRMQAALAALTTARSELQAGATNKGGHRMKALELVNDAIVEVQAGIAYAN